MARAEAGVYLDETGMGNYSQPGLRREKYHTGLCQVVLISTVYVELMTKL